MIGEAVEERSIVVGAATGGDQAMLVASVGVQESAIRQVALIREIVGVVGIGAAARVVQQFLTAIRVNGAVAQRASFVLRRSKGATDWRMIIFNGIPMRFGLECFRWRRVALLACCFAVRVASNEERTGGEYCRADVHDFDFGRKISRHARRHF